MAGHQHGYVRTSSAAAIAEAVQLWPQTVTVAITALQDFYREKVCRISLWYSFLSDSCHRQKF